MDRNDCKDVISIIVPVYNGEKYIKRCILSILKQTYKEIDIVVVDDGSEDKTRNILEQLKTENVRLKVFTKQNEGVAKARNYGLNKAEGKYIMFVDADDYIDVEYVEKMYLEIEHNDVDMVSSGFYEHDGESKKIIKLERKVLNAKKELYDFLTSKENYAATVVWGKLYKKEILNDMEFKRLTYGEDTLFITELWHKKIKVLKSDIVGYHYCRILSSATKTVSKNRIEFCSNNLRLARKKFCTFKDIDNALDNYENDIVDSIICFKRWDNDYEENSKMDFVNAREIIKPYIDEICENKRIGYKRKVLFWLYYNFPMIAWKII